MSVCKTNENLQGMKMHQEISAYFEVNISNTVCPQECSVDQIIPVLVKLGSVPVFEISFHWTGLNRILLDR